MSENTFSQTFYTQDQFLHVSKVRTIKVYVRITYFNQLQLNKSLLKMKIVSSDVQLILKYIYVCGKLFIEVLHKITSSSLLIKYRIHGPVHLISFQSNICQGYQHVCLCTETYQHSISVFVMFTHSFFILLFCLNAIFNSNTEPFETQECLHTCKECVTLSVQLDQLCYRL